MRGRSELSLCHIQIFFFSCHWGISGYLFPLVALFFFFSFSVSCGGGVQIDRFELTANGNSDGSRAFNEILPTRDERGRVA